MEIKKMTELFMDVMASTIQNKKTLVDKYFKYYTEDEDYQSMICEKFIQIPDNERLNKYYTMQAKYFSYAQQFMLTEDYEYITKCLTIIDKQTKLLAASFYLTYKKKSEVKLLIRDIEIGIAHLKQQLADGELLNEMES